MNTEKGIGSQMLGLLIYVCLSALGLTMIKLGLGSGSTVLIDKSGFSMNFDWKFIIGVCLYAVSFITSMIVMKGMNLSIFYPLSAGLIYIVVCVLSVVLLKEKLTIMQLVGMTVILAGIIIMNLGKGK